MAKPSARLAPAPPCFSGTQASVRPASDNARHNFSFQLVSRARLIVCGSARSANIRAAVSATILSLSVTIAAPTFYAMAGALIGPSCGAAGPLASGSGVARKWRAWAYFCPGGPGFHTGERCHHNKQKMSCRPATAASAAHPGEDPMGTKFVALATAILASLTLCTAQAAEPKHGGILKIYHRETPPSLSIHEEATFSVNIPAMGLFNNLVIYDQHKPQNSMGTIVPELATSWAWSPDNLKLTFKLREGVKWHDGQPFTAKDVKCTFDLIQGKGQDKFRKNPRKDLFNNISDVTTNGDFEVTLQLKRPQPSLLAMIASGYTPMYSCHVPTAQMRTHPIGTGPFKFVEFKQNESITLTKNPDYWKKGLPYLDGIEY